MDAVVLKNICKTYNGRIVLDNVNLKLEFGKLTCLMAPSGRGKTTLMRILLGLEKPDSGEIIGMDGLRCSAVFQEDRLCSELNAISNVMFAAENVEEHEVRSAMSAMLLDGFEEVCARELSGGMKRRVAMLRALFAQYDIIFLDEPFKGLDADTKAAVIAEVKARIAGKTAVLITHDKAEAEAMEAFRIIEF